MGRGTDFSSAELEESVSIWTGWGHEIAPNRDDSKLFRRFGEDVATQLLIRVKQLQKDFYRSKAFLATGRIVTAFAWCYTLDYR